MFKFLKRKFKGKLAEKIVEEVKKTGTEEEVLELELAFPGREINSIQYCSTHGSKLSENRICEECRKIALSPENVLYFNDPLNNDMNREGAHGDHFDRRMNDPTKQLLGNQNWQSCPQLIKHGYFCDNCGFMLFHRLNWCPRCGGPFHYRRMSWQEMCETYPDYKVGY